MKAYLGQEVTHANCSPVSTGGTWDACAPPQKKTKQINVKEEMKSLHIIEEQDAVKQMLVLGQVCGRGGQQY